MPKLGHYFKQFSRSVAQLRSLAGSALAQIARQAHGKARRGNTAARVHGHRLAVEGLESRQLLTAPAAFNYSLLKAADRRLIETHDLTRPQLLHLYHEYKGHLEDALGGRHGPFAKIMGNDKALMTVFAMDLAYEARGPIAPQVPSDGLKWLLDFSRYSYRSYGILCQQYTTLAEQLAQKMLGPNSGVKFIEFGVGQATITGNHVMQYVTGATGMNLILDATTATVGAGNLMDLENHDRIRYRRLSERNDEERSGDGFGQIIARMFQGAGLNSADLLYIYQGSAEKIKYDRHDFVTQTVPVILRGHVQYWSVTNDGATIAQTATGLTTIDASGTKTLVPIATNGVYRLTTHGRLYHIGVRSTTLVASQVAQVVAGPQFHSVYYLTTRGLAVKVTDLGAKVDVKRQIKSLVSTGTAVYLLTNSDALWMAAPRWRLVNRDTDALAAMRPPQVIPERFGHRLRLTIESPGQMITRDETDAGSETLKLFDSTGNQSIVLADAGQFLVGPRGATATILLRSGDVWQFNDPVAGVLPVYFAYGNGTYRYSNLYSVEPSDWLPSSFVSIVKLRFVRGWGTLFVEGIEGNGQTAMVQSALD